jgi:hypothetical protein
MVYERLARGRQFIAHDEVQRVQTDLAGTAVASLSVDEDVLDVADVVCVIGPQVQVDVAGNGHARGELCST